MARIYIVILLALAELLLRVQPAIAQSESQAASFEQAWINYVDARSGSSVAALVDTAEEALQTGRTFLPEGDERVAMLLHNYGDALLLADRNYEAREQFLDSLRIMEEVHGKHSLELLDTIKAAADAWGGHPQFASRHHAGYKRALKITARHYGKDSLEYADQLMEAGGRVYDQSRSDEGDKRIREALEYYEANLSTPDNRTGTALYYLGKIRFGKSNIRAAIEYLEKALPHFQGDSEGLRLSRLRTMALLVQSYDIKKENERVDDLVQRIGLETRVNDDQEPEALIVVNPEYPEQYHRAGIEGYVVVEFSIDDKGRVVNPIAIESDQSFGVNAEGYGGLPHPKGSPGARYDSLEDAAIEAVSKYRYAPRYVDGRPVFVHGVSVRVEFEKKR